MFDGVKRQYSLNLFNQKEEKSPNREKITSSNLQKSTSKITGLVGVSLSGTNNTVPNTSSTDSLRITSTKRHSIPPSQAKSFGPDVDLTTITNTSTTSKKVSFSPTEATTTTNVSDISDSSEPITDQYSQMRNDQKNYSTICQVIKLLKAISSSEEMNQNGLCQKEVEDQELKNKLQELGVDGGKLKIVRNYNQKVVYHFSINQERLEVSDFRLSGKQNEYEEYSPVSPDAFFTRAESVYKAVEKIINSNKKENKQLLNEKFNNLKEKIDIQAKLLKNDSEVILKKAKEEIEEKTGKKSTSKTASSSTDEIEKEQKKSIDLFEEKFNVANQAIVDFIVECSNDFNIPIDEIKETEKQIILENGRPTAINLFNISGESFMGVQRPQKAKENYTWIPPERIKGFATSAHREQVGLCNYVESSLYAIKSEQRDSQQIQEPGKEDKSPELKLLHKFIRHSSYPPIAEEDSVKRQKAAILNGKQLICDLASKHLINGTNQGEGGSEEDPIVINLSTMMLLSPIPVIDLLANRTLNLQAIKNLLYGKKPKWKGEGEAMQFRESLLAVKAYDGRTIELEIADAEGKPVKKYVQVKSTAMNIGMNVPFLKAAKFFGVSLFDELQQTANAKALVETSQQVVAHLEKQLTNGKISQADQKTIGELLKYLSPPPFSKASRFKEMYDSLEKQKAEAQKKIDDAMSKLDTPHLSQRDMKKARSEFKKAKGDLLEIEKSLGSFHDFTLDEMRLQRSSRKKDLRLKKKAVESVLKNNLNAETRDAIETTLKLMEAQNLYLTGDYLKKKHVGTMSALFIELHTKMGHDCEGFCKSAEDRTGRMDNILQERSISKYIEHSKSIINRMSARGMNLSVNLYSTSMNNTTYNSNAPGLQVGGSCHLNLGKVADMGKKMATTAKKVYAQAKKKQALQKKQH